MVRSILRGSSQRGRIAHTLPTHRGPAFPERPAAMETKEIKESRMVLTVFVTF